MTLTPGVYCFSSSAQLTGTLTLDGGGNPNANFVFQAGTSIVTAGSVVLINGAQALITFGTNRLWHGLDTPWPICTDWWQSIARTGAWSP
jgi:hypothetical protein